MIAADDLNIEIAKMGYTIEHIESERHICVIARHPTTRHEARAVGEDLRSVTLDVLSDIKTFNEMGGA